MKNKSELLTNIFLFVALLLFPQIASAHMYGIEFAMPFIFGFPVFVVSIVIFLILQQFDKERSTQKSFIVNLLNFAGLFFIAYSFSYIIWLLLDVGAHFSYYPLLDYFRGFVIGSGVVGVVLIIISKVKIKTWKILIFLPIISLLFTYYYKMQEELYVQKETQISIQQPSKDSAISSDVLVQADSATMCQDEKSMIYLNNNKLYYYTFSDKKNKEIYSQDKQAISSGSSLIFALSPKCDQIAIADGEMNQQLVLIDINGKIIHQGKILTSQKDTEQYQLVDPTESYVRSLNFSPDGNKIIFSYEVNLMRWANSGDFPFRIGVLDITNGKWASKNTVVLQNLSPNVDIAQIDSSFRNEVGENPDVLFASDGGKIITYRSAYGQKDGKMSHSNWTFTQDIPPTKASTEQYYWLKDYFRWEEVDRGINKLLYWNGDNEIWVAQGEKIRKIIVDKTGKGTFANSSYYNKAKFYETTWSPETIKTKNKTVDYQLLQQVGKKILVNRTITLYTKNLESSADVSILEKKSEILLLEMPTDWVEKNI